MFVVVVVAARNVFLTLSPPAWASCVSVRVVVYVCACVVVVGDGLIASPTLGAHHSPRARPHRARPVIVTLCLSVCVCLCALIRCSFRRVQVLLLLSRTLQLCARERNSKYATSAVSHLCSRPSHAPLPSPSLASEDCDHRRRSPLRPKQRSNLCVSTPRPYYTREDAKCDISEQF